MGSLQLLSTCDGDLREPLMLCLGSQKSLEFWRGFSDSMVMQGNRASFEVEVNPQDSSPVLTWISGFLWRFNRGVRPSSHVEKV